MEMTLYKFYSPDIFGGWSWHIDSYTGDEFTSVEAYKVEIPEGFHLAETVSGEKAFFKDGVSRGYQLTIGRNAESGKPYLVGGDPVEMVPLKVIEKI